jgi:hypothetical protein
MRPTLSQLFSGGLCFYYRGLFYLCLTLKMNPKIKPKKKPKGKGKGKQKVKPNSDITDTALTKLVLVLESVLYSKSSLLRQATNSGLDTLMRHLR